MELAKFASSER